MSLDRLQQAWKAESSQVRVSFDVDQLRREVQQSHDAFGSMIFKRDVREVGVALVMIPLWIAMGIRSSSPWTWYLMIPVLLWIAGFMLVDRRLHPQLPSEPGEPLLFSLRESLAQVEHQIWLLRNVFWWYLLPPSVAMGVFFIHSSWETTESWWGAILMTTFPGIAVYFVYRGVYWLNQTAVEKLLTPRRNDLVKLISNLEGECSDDDSIEIMNIASALNETDGRLHLGRANAIAAETWNRIIPSWREVAWIVIPTILSAYVVYQLPFEPTGRVAMRSVGAAVVVFLIVLFRLGYVAHRRYKDQPLTGTEQTHFNLPARTIRAFLLLLVLLAFVAFFIDTPKRKTQNKPDAVELDSSIEEAPDRADDHRVEMQE